MIGVNGGTLALPATSTPRKITAALFSSRRKLPSVCSAPEAHAGAAVARSRRSVMRMNALYPNPIG